MSSKFDRNEPMSREDKATHAPTRRELVEYHARQEAKAAIEAELAIAVEDELENDAIREALEIDEARAEAVEFELEVFHRNDQP